MKTKYLLLIVLFLIPLVGNSQQADECVDADGDGFGWNEALKQSCIPPGTTDSDRKNPVGVRISWPENAAAELVEGYTLKLLVNSALAAEESTEETSLNFQFTAINATFGDEICVQVAAFRRDETSAFSELNCIAVPEQVLPPISVPGMPAMVWFY